MTLSTSNSDFPQIALVDSKRLRAFLLRGDDEDFCSFLEQSGLHVANIARFKLTERALQSQVFFPTSIIFPGHPRGYLTVDVSLPSFAEKVTRVTYDGIAIRAFSSSKLHVSLFVSPSHPTVWAILRYSQEQVTPDVVGVPRRSRLRHPCETAQTVWKDEQWTSTSQLQIAHTTLDERSHLSPETDLAEREKFVKEWTRAIRLNCPLAEISTLLHFAKIRAQESVYDAPNLGRVHSPGGGMFYAGVWCNDQAEYAAPVLAMLGGPRSRTRNAAVNSLVALARWFDTEGRSVPYSVEVDGGYIGRLDRGDAGMYAWGASLTLLTCGDPVTTSTLFPNIRFTCDVLLEQINRNPDSIVPSESDELEGRFPSGDANFSVNCICVLALEASAEAATEAGESRLASVYAENAVKLRENVDRYFRVSGPQGYGYFKGCKDARGWVCLAALAKLARGRDALLYALNELWSEDGILTTSTSSEVWDRCTLYGIRAAFQTEMVELATKRLKAYAWKRTTEGCAVPFAVESNSSYAQLSAESALVIRVITEGLLGICVKHGGRVRIRPECPPAWPGYAVTSVFIADKCLDFEVTRKSSWLVVDVHCDDRNSHKRVLAGADVVVQLFTEPLLNYAFNNETK